MTQYIQLSAPVSGGATLIPNVFFDVYMPEANGDFVKIYLCLIRYFQAGQLGLSVPDIADTFNLTESDVVRALRYWERKGLISISEDNTGSVTDICIRQDAISDFSLDNSQTAQGSSDVNAPAPQSAPAVQSASAPQFASASQYASASQSVPSDRPAQTGLPQTAASGDPVPEDEKPGIALIAEQYLGHPLGRLDIEKIDYFSTGYGFSFELIDYLFEYCADIGKTDMKYVEKVAQGWHSGNIRTVEEARLETELHRTGARSVMKELGCGSRNPAPVELNYIRRWIRDYGFPMDMVLEACRRTVLNTDSHRFEYTEGILSGWRANGIDTPEKLRLADEERKRQLRENSSRTRKTAAPRGNDGRAASPANRFHNFDQRDYDFHDLEQQLLRRSRAQD